jgi:hypothetical protein
VSNLTGWYVRVTTDQVYDGVYNTLLYIAGYPKRDEAESAVKKARGANGETYQTLPEPIISNRGPQPAPGEVRLLVGAV